MGRRHNPCHGRRHVSFDSDTAKSGLRRLNGRNFLDNRCHLIRSAVQYADLVYLQLLRLKSL